MDAMDHNDELLARLADDVKTWFPQLVMRYQDQLYIFARRLTGNGQEAEDIVQDALLGAYITLLQYPSARIRMLNVRPWLYKLTLNVFRNSKRGQRLLLTPLETDEEEHPILALSIADEELPEALVERSEQRQRLEQLLHELPEHYRVVIACYYFSQFSYQEIADLLEQPIGTIKSRMHRGLLLLQQRMQEEATQRRTGYGR